MARPNVVHRYGGLVLTLTGSFLLAIPPLSWATSSTEAAAGEKSELEFVSLEKRNARTFKKKYRVGDYVVTHGRSTSKFDRKSDVATYDLTVDVVASNDARAQVKMERREYWGVVYPRDASLGEAVLDAVLEETVGASIWHDSADEVLQRTVLSGTVTIADGTVGTWQIEAEQRPVPTDESFGTTAIWGYGTLTNGARTLDFVYRGASPWSREECAEMFRAQDERGDQCHARVTRIEEDGELLAWSDRHKKDDYNFRVGLDVETMLLVLVVFDLGD